MPQNLDDRIDVFISSRCGDDQIELSIIRNGLKHALEETGLFKVYLFEKSSPSSENVKKDYSRYLIKSDVCLFLIDTKLLTSDSGGGVLEEIRVARQNSIRSIFIFEKSKEEEKNPNIAHLQVSKHYSEYDIEEVISRGYKALINEIIQNYKRNIFTDDDNTEIDADKGNAASILSSDKQILTFIPKKTFIDHNKYKKTQNTFISSGVCT